MEHIFDVSGGPGGKAFLLVGKDKSALMDCGMAYCAADLIDNIKQILGSRELNYILISHSHYDHIGAIPYLRREWPGVRVLGAEYAQRILNRPSALKTIRELSTQAALLFDGPELPPYDDAALKVDVIIKDGDELDLGGVHMEVIKTGGHTQCSLSFLINNDTLFASESTGYMSESGVVYPSFIISCADAIESIRICRNLHPRSIISPHYGLVREADTADYWGNCLLAIRKTQKFILDSAAQSYDEAWIIREYERLFRDDDSRREQPTQAFRLNAQNMINNLLRESSGDKWRLNSG